jgi:hypothetical protein
MAKENKFNWLGIWYTDGLLRTQLDEFPGSLKTGHFVVRHNTYLGTY